MEEIKDEKPRVEEERYPDWETAPDDELPFDIPRD